MVTISKPAEDAVPPKKTGPPRRKATRAALPVGRLSLDEINALYPPREWVLLKVIATDEDDVVTQAEVLAHSKSRRRLSKHVIRAHQEDPRAELYPFLTGLRIPTQEEWREELAAAAGLPPAGLNAWG